MTDRTEELARVIATSCGANPDECVLGYSWNAGELGREDAGSVCHKRRWEDFADHARAILASPVIAGIERDAEMRAYANAAFYVNAISPYLCSDIVDYFRAMASPTP